MNTKGFILAGVMCAACDTFGIGIVSSGGGEIGVEVSGAGAVFSGFVYDSGQRYEDGAGMRLADGVTAGFVFFTQDNPVSEFHLNASTELVGQTISIAAYDFADNLIGVVVGTSIIDGGGIHCNALAMFGNRPNSTLLSRVEITADAPFWIDSIIYKDYRTQADAIAIPVEAVGFRLFAAPIEEEPPIEIPDDGVSVPDGGSSFAMMLGAIGLLGWIRSRH